MIYTYECKTCETQRDEVFRYTDFPREVKCNECGGVARKIIVVGHGGVHDDHPTWLNDDVIEALQDTNQIRLGREKRIETRSEHKAHLEKYGIIATG